MTDMVIDGFRGRWLESISNGVVTHSVHFPDVLLWILVAGLLALIIVGHIAPFVLAYKAYRKYMRS